MYNKDKKGDIEAEKKSCKFFKNLVILSFVGYDDINEVEAFRNCDIYVSREDAVPLEEGEYYISDVIGSDVYEDNGSHLGTVNDVLQTGANDVFTVAMENGRELLIPVINDCVIDIDTEGKKVIVKLMKGMLD